MDDLVDFASLGPENLAKLGEDFMRTFLVLSPTHPRWQIEKHYTDRVSEVVPRAGRSPTSLSSRDATVLAETFHKVSFHHQTFPRSLKPPVVRV